MPARSIPLGSVCSTRPYRRISTGGAVQTSGATRTILGGNHRSHCTISPDRYSLQSAGSAGVNNGRNSATLARSTNAERVHPIRSAITVAGIVGVFDNNARICGSNTSTTDPARARSYFGGPSEANAARTVFLATPQLAGDRLNRHLLRLMEPSNLGPILHADHSLTLTEGVNVHSAPKGQYSGSIDTRKDAPTMNRTKANPANTREWFPDACLPTKLSLQSDLGSSHGRWRASNEPEPTSVFPDCLGACCRPFDQLTCHPRDEHAYQGRCHYV